MHIQQVNPELTVPAYNIACQALEFSHHLHDPFHVVWCHVEPSGSTTPQQHHEVEAFFILQGQALMHINGTTRDVSAGDLIHIPSHASHKISNTSTSQSLSFLSIYSQISSQQHPHRRQQIFSPPPTPNGELHLGHISGPYLSGDVLTRFYRMYAIDVEHISGTDDFQSYVFRKANSDTQLAIDIAEDQRQKIISGFTLADIDFSQFNHPVQNHQHQQEVTTFFKQLHDKGMIYEKDIELAYCNTCDDYISEASMLGCCPSCDELSVGASCETCAHVATVLGGLKQITCLNCKQPSSTLKTSRQWVFSTVAYHQALESYYATVDMSDSLRDFVCQLMTLPLNDFVITQPSIWGISVKDNHHQTFNAWFEMAAMYWAASQQQSDITYTFGWDNSFYYAYLIPCLLMANNNYELLPNAMIKNDFYLLQGEKFSTSREHAIWANEIFQEYNSDLLRFYLARTRSENGEGNFDVNEFNVFIKQVIENNLNNWIQRINNKLANTKQTQSTNSLAHQLLSDANSCVNQAVDAYGVRCFSLNKIADILVQLVYKAHVFSKYQTHISIELAAVKAFAQIALPLMPKYAAQLLDALSSAQHWSHDIAPVAFAEISKLPKFDIRNDVGSSIF